MTLKKLINNPDTLIDELIEGLISAHPRQLYVTGETKRAIVAHHGPRPGKVGIVVGGGSGHEPAFAGYVGKGLADAAPVGNIFASPSPAHIIDAATAAEQGAGVLFLYGNYAGDVMNFDMAAEHLNTRGIRAESLLVTDDIASAPSERASERRGIAGNFFVFKIAGAAADLGMTFDEVKAAATLANTNVRTMGVALSACSMPQTGKANFDIPVGEMEVGMGIHGEPGVERTAIESADDVTDRLLEPILAELGCTAGDSVAVLVNGLGATTLLEQYIIHRRVAQLLSKHQVRIHHSWVGEYCTSLEMAGVSITLMKLNDDLTKWLDHPCETPALRVGQVHASHADLTNFTQKTALPNPVKHEPQDISQLKADGDVSPEMFRAALFAVGKKITKNRDMLCELDGVIGDGDHGVTMDIGWRAIAEALERSNGEFLTISQISEICADAFLSAVGASAGPLYASGFHAAAHAVKDRLNLDPASMALWISAMADGIADRGQAKIGDKTMVDAWLPAAKSAMRRAESGLASSAQIVEAAALKAQEGAERTKQLISSKGRARTLGAQSLGHADPGATSAFIILDALHKSFSE